MSMKKDSASLRVSRVGAVLQVSLVHRGRRGKQTVVRPVLCSPHGDSLRNAVSKVMGQGALRLRVPEEVYEKWLSETSHE